MSQQINLLNPILLSTKDWLNARLMAMLAGLTIILMVIASGWTSYRVSQLTQEQQVVTQELAQLKQQLDFSIKLHVPRAPSSDLQNQVTAAEMRLKEQQQVQTFLKGGGFAKTQGFSDYMTAFAHQGMKGLWLTQFSIDNALSKITISGRALDAGLVPHYISGLGHEPILSGSEFATLDMNALMPMQSSPLAVNALPVSSTLTPLVNTANTPTVITPSIIEFKLQSQDKKMPTEAAQSAVQQVAKPAMQPILAPALKTIAPPTAEKKS